MALPMKVFLPCPPRAPGRAPCFAASLAPELQQQPCWVVFGQQLLKLTAVQLQHLLLRWHCQLGAGNLVAPCLPAACMPAAVAAAGSALASAKAGRLVSQRWGWLPTPPHPRRIHTPDTAPPNALNPLWQAGQTGNVGGAGAAWAAAASC